MTNALPSAPPASDRRSPFACEARTKPAPSVQRLPRTPAWERARRDPDEPSLVGIVNAREGLVDSTRQRCSPVYRVQSVSLAQAAAGNLPGLEVLLLDWRGMDALQMRQATLLSIRSSVPLIALCDQQARAQQIAALTAGTDYTVTPPVSAALLQALLVSYRRRPPKGHNAPMDNAPMDRGERTRSLSMSHLPDEAISPPARWNGGPPREAAAPTAFISPDAPQAAEPRSNPLVTTDNMCQRGPVAIDPERGVAWLGDQELALRPRPLNLLLYLMRHAGRCCRREAILRDVWDLDFDPSTNVIDVQIYVLRQQFKKRGVQGLIQTVHGKGYKFVGGL